MPILKKEAHERFARLVAAGGHTKREAYREARAFGQDTLRSEKVLRDLSLSQQASKLLRRPDIKARIDELRSGATKETIKSQVTVAKKIELKLEHLIEEADKIQQAAFSNRQYAGAIQALIAKAKLAGLWIEKTETTNAHYAISDEPMSRDEWKAEFVTGTQH